MKKKRIGLFHGAILNSGDFLIFNRGKRLLQEYLNDEYELVDVKRWEPSSEELDALVILGGPIISRGLHSQAKNMVKYLEKGVPVVCLGLGVSGERYSSEEDYFTPESVEFWEKVYQSSHLFSVRDKKTQKILGHYGIEAEFTGCPALYDLGVVDDRRLHGINYDRENTPQNRKIAVTIPHIHMEANPVSLYIGIRNFFYTLFFIYSLKSRVKGVSGSGLDTDFLLILQHGYSTPIRLIGRYAARSGFRILDTSHRGLDEVDELRDASFHIGSRLHSHIFFLSLDKPSYLLSVDNRTSAFLGNFHMESENYSPSGITRLASRFREEMDNPDVLESNVRKTSEEIMRLFTDMEDFLFRVDRFFSSI